MHHWQLDEYSGTKATRAGLKGWVSNLLALKKRESFYTSLFELLNGRLHHCTFIPILCNGNRANNHTTPLSNTTTTPSFTSTYSENTYKLYYSSRSNNKNSEAPTGQVNLFVTWLLWDNGLRLQNLFMLERSLQWLKVIKYISFPNYALLGFLPEWFLVWYLNARICGRSENW